MSPFRLLHLEAGTLEMMLPTFVMLLPEKMSEKVGKTLIENENVLVSGIDIHRTFLDIAQVQQTNYTPKGQSVFTKLPSERGCESIHVGDNDFDCVCQKRS